MWHLVSPFLYWTLTYKFPHIILFSSLMGRYNIYTDHAYLGFLWEVVIHPYTILFGFCLYYTEWWHYLIDTLVSLYDQTTGFVFTYCSGI